MTDFNSSRKQQQKIFLTALAIMVVVINANCQKKVTAWKIVYELQDLDSLSFQAIDSNLRTHEVFWIKDNKQRAEISTKKDPKAMVILYDEKTDDHTFLVAKTKLAMINNFKMPGLNLKPAKHIFNYTDESKIISGHKCYKAIMTFEGRNDRDTIYYTKEIKALNGKVTNDYYSGLDGCLMEFVNSDSHYHRYKYQVTKMNKDEVD